MIAVAVLPLALASAEIETGERLVMVGRNGSELDACGAVGQVYGLDTEGDSLLGVHIAPAISSREKDRVENGNRLFLCDESGDWYGVVYQKAGDTLQDCGAGSPSAFVGAYRGPCRYGWVHKYFVEFLAG
ncbi:hypothetical protein [Erythrobacter sp. JK5]|uniref:hypothetical protein n=1 Tax=Erythrobacter sp. JK5 TaxID=2829500 RepID=UPI001BAB3818|nr:hypothetical protein [Erythrobacter sp. JK5]QUL38704.1 hypothetical protein KDC96_04800 [Erythrobacter sp. JK5]